jgi:hypothetical protein
LGLLLAFIGIIADCCGSLRLTLADQGISIELCLRWTNLGLSSFLVAFEQHLAAQLENEAAITDATAREEVQRTAFNDGNLIQQIGALLLELGRTTLSLHMGQSPGEAVVNAGPAIFISPAGPNPIMVQVSRIQCSLPFCVNSNDILLSPVL